MSSHPRSCRHERAHVFDSRFHADGYSTPASRKIFCDVGRLQRWLDVEVALSRSQAELGAIPATSAEEIARAARIENLDQEAIARSIKTTRHSLIGLLRALEAAVGTPASSCIHLGATTQDIQDTGQVLEMRDVLDAVQAELRALLLTLQPLALRHRRTLMIGRTHARSALPTTFGLKVAGWIDELMRHLDRIAEARPRLLVAELGGGVGTMAAFGDQAQALLTRFAARLGLAVPRVAWHAIRDRVAEFGSILGMVAATMARIADEIRALGRPEVGELEEGWAHGQIGSSTMPHKRNPEVCEQVVVLARLARSQVGVLLDAMLVEHERDGRALRLEWPAVAEISHCTMAAQAMVSSVVAELQVHDDVMAAHAIEAGDLICSEALMLALGAKIGKVAAYAKVYDLSQMAQSRRQPLKELLAADPEVRLAFGDTLEQILDPTQYLGAAGELVDRTLEELARRLYADESRPEPRPRARGSSRPFTQAEKHR